MYLVSKDIRTIESVTKPSTQNIIDILFNDQVEVQNVVTYTEDIHRTYTQKLNDVSTHAVSESDYAAVLVMISNIIDRHPNPEEEYTHFKIPKRTHGFREIDAPTDKLKTDMKKISDILIIGLKLLTHDSAWAYIKGRDVVGAVHEHTNNKSRWYLKIDFHNFFGSCNEEFIYNQLKQVYPFAAYDNEDYNNQLKKLIKFCMLRGGLPQGTPISPLITNLIMIPFDYELNQRLKHAYKNLKTIPKQKYVYTRYADDIIVSGRYGFDYKAVESIIIDLIKDTPLTINTEKTRYGSSSGRNWNLGIMCNKYNEATVGYRQKHKVKGYINEYIHNYNAYTKADVQWLLGQLSWLHNVEPEYFNSFLDYINRKYNIDILHKIKTHLKSFN